jgi:hypothetical protein
LKKALCRPIVKEKQTTDKKSFLEPSMERYIAIDNVCAWPNLTLLPV